MHVASLGVGPIPQLPGELLGLGLYLMVPLLLIWMLLVSLQLCILVRVTLQ